jgi:hypothetical protein
MASRNGSDKPYKIGRGKPPTHTQFKPGQSGNRNGRRKGSRNYTTALRSELQQRVTATIEGRRKRITKRDLLIKQLVNKGVAGDPKMMPILLNEIRAIEAIADTKGRRSGLTKEDRLILKNIVKRIRNSSSTDTEDDSSKEEPSSDDDSEGPDGEEDS